MAVTLPLRMLPFTALQLHTRSVKTITYNPGDQTLSLQAGANWGEIYAALAPLGRIAVGGHAQSVCAAGCLLGGCHGILARTYGLGMDQIVSLRCGPPHAPMHACISLHGHAHHQTTAGCRKRTCPVHRHSSHPTAAPRCMHASCACGAARRLALYNGSIVTASAAGEHAELFNALLGAGHSSYGVVLSFVLRTYPAPPAVSEFVASFNLAEGLDDLGPTGSIANALYSAAWLAAIPPEFSFDALVLYGYARVSFKYVGDDYDNALRWLRANVLRRAGLVPESLDTTNYTTVAAWAEATYEVRARVRACGTCSLCRPTTTSLRCCGVPGIACVSAPSA